MRGVVLWPGLWVLWVMDRDGDGQGLTLVHFSAQPEPFLTQTTP